MNVLEHLTILRQLARNGQDDKRIYRDLQEQEGFSDMTSLKVGMTVFIRTVTYHYIGTVVEKTIDDFTMHPCVWVPNSGRWYQAMKNGTLAEVEPEVTPVTLSLAMVTDFRPWNHPIPTQQV